MPASRRAYAKNSAIFIEIASLEVKMLLTTNFMRDV
jgi:hypothetical protein